MTGSITGNLSGSVGSVTGAVGSVTGSVGSVTGAVGSVTGNVGGNVVGSVGSLTATAVQNIWDDLTSNNTVVGSIGLLISNNLNASVSSRATDAGVWTNATRTLTAGTNIVLAKGTGITGFNDISASNVWSEVLPGSYTSTQAGFKLNAAGSAADPWSTTLPGAYSAGTAGFIIGNRLDQTVSSRMATFTLPTNFSALSISIAGAVTAGTVSDKSGYSLSQAFPANFSSLAITAGGSVTAGTVSDKTGYSLSGSQTFSTTGSVGSVSAGVTVSTNNDKTGYSLTTAPLTSGQTASAVWDALLASYSVNNSFGQRVLRSTSAQSACAVTGANHIAADIHELQPAVITAADFSADAIDANALATSAVTEIQTGLATLSALSSVSAVTDKLNTAMQIDGAVYQFTTNALELAPTGGGPGGGSTVTVRMGPFVIASGKKSISQSGQIIDIIQGSAHQIDIQLVDANKTGIDITGATIDCKVYSSSGSLVATYPATATYAGSGQAYFAITTAVTNTPGYYTLIASRSLAGSITIFGSLGIQVREM